MMKKQKTLGVASLVLGIAMLVGCGVRMILAEQQNQPIKSNFVAAELDPGRSDAAKLAQRQPLEQVDVLSYARYATYNTVAQQYTKPLEYRLHTTLRYYAAPGDAHPALTLEAGTAVQALPLDYSGSYESPTHFYGTYRSFPTYQNGWRYTRAYLTNTVAQGEETSIPFYYIRTDDLLKEEKAQFDEEMAQQGITGVDLDANWEVIKKDVLFALDNKLYNHGIYISPDLLTPVWDGWNIALCAAGIVLCLLGLVLLLCKGARRERSTAAKISPAENS